MLKGVELADEARRDYQEKTGKSIKVALSLGCYGAILANGAEYSGERIFFIFFWAG